MGQLVLSSGKVTSPTTMTQCTATVWPQGAVGFGYPSRILKSVDKRINNHGSPKGNRGLFFTHTFETENKLRYLFSIRIYKRVQGILLANSTIVLLHDAKAPKITVDTVFPESSEVLSGLVNLFYGNAYIITPQQANEVFPGAFKQDVILKYCDPLEVHEDFIVKSITGESPHLDNEGPLTTALQKVQKPKRRIRI